jgi:ribose/xylose/arabinose/galactoside ABC-type transport system permease subunit
MSRVNLFASMKTALIDSLSGRKKIKMTFDLALFIILVILFFAIGIINPVFFEFEYLAESVLKNIIEIGLIALPTTIILITGGIDFSIGSTMILSAAIGGLATYYTGSGLLGFLVCILIGLACGFLNAILITKLKLPPMVVTLATMYLYLGLARGFTQGLTMTAVPAFSVATFLGTKMILSVPLQIYIWVFCVILFSLLLSKSYFGRVLYAIGLNENATRFAGINTDFHKIVIYTLSGLICALAGMIFIGRFSSVTFASTDGITLKIVTVVVLGGVSILGGKGSIRGTVLGTLIIAVLNGGLTLISIPITTQKIVQGMVLIISLIANAVIQAKAFQYKRASKASDPQCEKEA